MTKAGNDDEAFKAWIRLQPSCLTGRFTQWVDGVGMNPACHVRRAATSGTAFKAPLSCVPLHQEEHLVQHGQGEAACLERYLGGTWSVETAKEFFDSQVVKYREEWERTR